MNTKVLSPDDPRIIRWLIHPTFQAVFAVVALITIVYFIVQFYILCPYDGMSADFYDADLASCTLVVDAVYPRGPAEEAGIQTGDQVLSIGGQLIDCLRPKSLYKPGLGPGEVVTVEIQRGDQTLTRSITIGSYIDAFPMLAMIIGTQLLALGFWVSGLVLGLFTPPHAVGPRLIGICWLVTGIAAAATGLGGWTSLPAYTTMLATPPLSLLVSVAAHLYFPIPHLTARWRRGIIYTCTPLALLASVLTLLELLAFNPHGFSINTLLGGYTYEAARAFDLLFILISLGLLVHSRLQVQDRDTRRQANIILWGTALGAAPYAAVASLDIFGRPSSLTYSYAILFILLIPLAYAYVIYQRKLVQVDFAINRAVVLFVFILLTFIVAALVLVGLTQVLDLPTESALLGGVTAAMAALLAPRLRRAVQRRVDLILYGCHYDFPAITGSFAERLAQAVDRQTLTHLLTHDLAERMGIRRAALLLAEGDTLAPQPPGDQPLAIPPDDAACRALLTGKHPCRAEVLWADLPSDTQACWRPLEWAQVLAPLIYQERLHGVLLLGGRHQGDIYSDADLRIVSAVAHQGALAWENVRLVESLRALNRQLVRADEAQRKQVARDLHDAAMQQLFFAKQSLLHDREEHAPLIELLDSTVHTLRRTIRGLRPPLLDQGLPVALEGLVDEMRKTTAGPSPAVAWRSNTGDSLPLPDEQATALYRITQEALTNALKHAGARQITVSLMAERDHLRLCVADDGVGAAGEREGHYGLTGMRERAAMIGARLHVDSAPGQGTRVTVEVKANPVD